MVNIILALAAAAVSVILSWFLGDGTPSAIAYANAAALLRRVPFLSPASLTALAFAAEAVFVFLATLVVRGMLTVVNRSGRRAALYDNVIAPALAFVAAVVFGVAGPVRLVAGSFSPFVPSFALLLLAWLLMVRFMRKMGAGAGAACAARPPYHAYRLAHFLTGLVLVVSPVTLLLPIVYHLLYLVACAPLARQREKDEELDWRLARLPKTAGLSYAAGVLLGLAAFFALSETWTVQQIVPLALTQGRAFFGAIGTYGWIVTIPLMLVLSAVVVALVYRLSVLDRLPGFSVAVIVFAGFLLLTQVTGPLMLRSWTWIGGVTMVDSPEILAVLSFLSALGFAAALAYYFLSDRDENDAPAIIVRITLASVIALVFLGLFAFGFAGERKVGRVRASTDALAAACADELEGVTRAFVDPAFSDALAYRYATTGVKGPELVPVTDAGSAPLRAAYLEKPEEKIPTAYQLGFDLWRRDGKSLPKAGLFSAFDAAEPKVDRAALDALAATVRATFDENALAIAPSADRELFLAFVWRMIRLARLRAAQEIVAGDDAAATTDVTLADELETRHMPAQRILARLREERRRAFDRLTPVEGLRLALSRADFASAVPYARERLKEKPEDVDANFALGMFYLTGSDFASSIVYLTRAAKGAPNQGAILNNLAYALFLVGRKDEALAFSKQALELLPESPEVKSVNALIRGLAPMGTRK